MDGQQDIAEPVVSAGGGGRGSKVPPVAAAAPVPTEFPIPFPAFAALLLPRWENTRRGHRMIPGQPDEVWLKLLRRRHGNEKHTVAEWQALIEKMRHQPAYRR